MPAHSTPPNVKRGLRILHLAHVRWYNAEAQYALDLACEMRHRGHGVAFLAQAGSEAVGKAREAGLETFEEAGLNRKGLGAAEVVAAAVRLRRVLRQGRFDAVEIHRSEGLPLIAWACRRAGTPLVRVRGDMRPVRADPLNRLLYRRLFAAVVASNSSIESSLRDRLGSFRHLVTIPGGVDPSLFSPEGPQFEVREALGFPRGSFLVGILGRLGMVKGHDEFLNAARAVLEEGGDACFVIVSKHPTPREEELRVRVEQDPRLRGRVGFLGHRPDLPAVLRAFDLGVVASTGSEANCRVGLEWMASGVPLLATQVGVLPDLVSHGETGFLVPAGSPSALAEKIGILAKNPDGARRMGALARGRVLDRFTLARCAEAHETLLRDILAEGRSP